MCSRLRSAGVEAGRVTANVTSNNRRAPLVRCTYGLWQSARQCAQKMIAPRVRVLCVCVRARDGTERAGCGSTVGRNGACEGWSVGVCVNAYINARLFFMRENARVGCARALAGSHARFWNVLGGQAIAFHAAVHKICYYTHARMHNRTTADWERAA